MARKYLTPIDLTGLELTNFRIQNLTSNPSAYGKGHTYYNTSANELRTYNGTSWETVGGNVISGATGSRPAAGHAGRLFFDTTKSVLFFDNGTTWVQDGVSQGDLDAAISGAALGSTDDLSEGTTNKYFTTQRARESLSATSGVDYSSSSGTFSINYTSLETQLVNDNFAKTSDIPSLSGYIQTGDDASLTSLTLTHNGSSGENLQIGDDVWIGDVNISNTFNVKGVEDSTQGYISFGQNGTTRSGAGKKNYIGSDSNDLTIGSANDVVLIPTSGYAYIGTQLMDGSNRIATIGDIGAGSGYVTETGTETLTNKTMQGMKVTGTTSFRDGSDTEYLRIEESNVGTARLIAADDLSLRATNDIILYPGNDAGGGHTGKAYIHWGNDATNAYPDREIATLGSIQGTTDQISIDRSNSQATISLPTYINVDNGEFHLKKNEYWLDGTQYGLVTANGYSGKFTVAAVNRDLELESSSDNVIINTPNYLNVNYGTDYTAFSVNTGGAVTAVRNELNVTNNDNYSTIVSNGNNETLVFNSAYYDQYVGSIKTDGTGFKIEGGSSGLVLSTTGNDIVLTPDNHVQINSRLYVNNAQRSYLSGGVYIGGVDYESDGYVQVQDASGNNTFVVSAGNGSATVDLHGSQNFYESQPDGGTQYGSITYDVDTNFVINANQNNLVLQSDSNNSVYLGSVSDANKVVKKSDLTELSSGLNWKQAANLLYDASSPVLTGDTVTSPLVIDGHPALGTAEAGVYRVLITQGDNAGIYVYNVSGTTWTLDRASDADVYTELIGAAIFIMEGDSYAATSWVQNDHYITDFTGQTWVQFSGQGTYTAGDGIDINGREISVKLDSDSLSKSGSGLKVNYHTDGGLDNDGGLYVKTGLGLEIDNSGNVAIDTAVVARKYSQDLTYSGSATSSFTVTHSLGTKHVQVTVFEVATGEDVIVDVSRPTNDTVQIDFAVAPSSGEYTAVVVG